MSFQEVLSEYQDFDFASFFAGVTDADVQRSLDRASPNAIDFLTLLSPRAADHLEALARRAQQLTVQYFGRTIQMFIPLYLSNHCNNRCTYCGFNVRNAIARRALSFAEIEREAAAIARTGMQHVLILTGEDRRITPPDYLADAAAVLRRHFASVSIEVYPLHTEEYAQLKVAGVDGMTVFQETYDPVLYKTVHLGGNKRDFGWRLDAPERAAQAGLRTVNIGALLGLAEPRSEMFRTGLHARYLEDRYLQSEVAVSFPRINAAEGDFTAVHAVDDRLFVQMITALRIFLPRAGITLSTRERAALRDRLLPLGVTRLSAGVSTRVGGYASLEVPSGASVSASVIAPSSTAQNTPQFEITDTRSVAEVTAAIVAQRYQPVFKDWEATL